VYAIDWPGGVLVV